MKLVVLINNNNLSDDLVISINEIWKQYINSHIEIQTYFIKILNNDNFLVNTIDKKNNTLYISNINFQNQIIQSIKCLTNNKIFFNYLIFTHGTNFISYSKMYDFLSFNSVDYMGEDIKGIPVKTKYKKYFENIDRKNRLYACGSILVLSKNATDELITNTDIDLTFDDEIMIGLVLTKKYKPCKILISNNKTDIQTKNKFFIYNLLSDSSITNINEINEYATELLNKLYNADELNTNPFYKIKKIHDKVSSNIIGRKIRLEHSNYEMEFKLKDKINGNEYNLANVPVYNNGSNSIDYSYLDDIIRIINLYSIKNDKELFEKIFNEIKNYNNKIKEQINFNNGIKEHQLSLMNENIEKFITSYSLYEKILLVCDKNIYEEYVVCEGLKNIFNEFGCDTCILYFSNDTELLEKSTNLHFKPNLIIVLTNSNLNLKNIFNVHVILIINSNIGKNIISNNNFDWANNVDAYYSNNYGIKKIIETNTNINSTLFYSSYIPFYKTNIRSTLDNFNDKTYDYGLIVDDFKFRDVKKSLEYLKNKRNVILIGKNSNLISNPNKNFKLIDLTDLKKYENKIKYIIKNETDEINNFDIQSFINQSVILQNYAILNYNVLDEKINIEKNKNYVFGNFSYLYSNINLEKLFKSNSVELYFLDQNQTKDFVLLVNLNNDLETNIIDLLKISNINSNVIGYNKCEFTDDELINLYYLYGKANINKNLIGIEMFYDDYSKNIVDEKYSRKFNKNLFMLIYGYYCGSNNLKLLDLKIDADIFHKTDILVASKTIKGYGGVQKTSRQLIMTLDLKYNVHILSNNLKNAEFDFEIDFLDMDIPHILIVKLKKTSELERYLNEAKFEFIINNKLEAMFNLNFNKQQSVICHNSMDPFNNQILKKKYMIDKLFTINNFHRNLLIHNGWDKEIYLYNNYIFELNEKKSNITNIEPRTKFTYNIGFIGRLSSEKNIQLIIDGVNHFNLSNELKIKLNLYIIGSGNEILFNLNENIKLLGFLDKERIDEYYKIFDYVISGSLTEGKSFSIIEALDKGIPCIHSKINGINEILFENQNGFLFELQNYSEIKFNMGFEALDKIKYSNNSNNLINNTNILNISNSLIKAYSISIEEWNCMSKNSFQLLGNEYDKDFCIKTNLNNLMINTMRRYNKKYKIFVNFKPDENQAYGGGNISMYYIIRFISSKYSDFIISYNLEIDIDLFIIVDPFSDGKFKKYSLDDVIRYRREANNKGKIIIRINDCDKTRVITNPAKSREYQIIKNISNIDYLVFNSNFIKSYYFKKFKEFQLNTRKIKYDIIVNGCDQSIFVNKEKLISNNVKIVTHHWSNNINKGYETYYKLWEYSQTNLDCGFEFVFIGLNVPDMFKKVPIIGPFVKNELSDELNKCDIYITDSKFDSCPNHVLEALSCGLPILYSNCEGGARELCTMSDYPVGEIYNDLDELIIKINKIKNNYNFYCKNIEKSKNLYAVNNCVSKYYNVFLKNIKSKNSNIELKYTNNIIKIISNDSNSNLLMDGLNFQLVKGTNIFAVNKNTYKNIQLLTNSNNDLTFSIDEFSTNSNKLTNDKINVLFCSDSKYFVGLFAVLHSVITNTNYLFKTHFNFIIPIDDLNTFSKLLIEFELKMCLDLSKTIIYLDFNIIDETIGNSKCYNGGGHLLNVGNFSRLLIGEFMLYKKLIYLDSDSIVQSDIIRKLSRFELEYPIYAGCANLSNSNKQKQIVIRMGSILNCDYDWTNLIDKKINSDDYVYMGAPFIADCSKWDNVYNQTINIIKSHNNTNGGIYKLFTMSIQNIIFYEKTGNIGDVLNVLADLGSSKKVWEMKELIDKDILDWSGIYKPWYLNGQYKYIWDLHDIMGLSSEYGEINGNKNTIESFSNNIKANYEPNINSKILISKKYLNVKEEIFDKFNNYVFSITNGKNKKMIKYNILYVCDAKYLMEKMSRVRFWAIEELGKYNNINLTLIGPGFTNFTFDKTLQENIQDLKINFDLIIWYKPLDKSYNFNLKHKLPFKTCLRYNEMWDENWTCKEIDETMSDIIICHHYNDYLKYKNILYKNDKSKTFIYNPHHANKNIFKPLNINKDIDILISGVTKKTHYPLKHRLFNLINKYKDTKLAKYNVYIHKHPGYNNSLNFENTNQIHYNELISRSKLCVCCTSKYNYRLGKYVEIPMGGSVIVGDLPYEDIRFGNFIIEITNEMEDDEIIDIIIKALENQDELNKKIKIGIDWAKNYTTHNYTDNLINEIFNNNNKKIFIISDEIRENHPEFGNQKWICDILKQEFISKFPLHTTINAGEADIIWYLAPWNYRHVPQGFNANAWFEFLKTKKVIFTQHHIDDEKFANGELNKQFEFMKTFGNKFHAICNLTKTSMRKYFTNFPIGTQKLWINNDVFYHIENKLELRKKYNFDLDSYLIGSFQKDTEGKTNLPKLSKGPDIFINIIKDMYKSNNKIQIVLTGLRREYIINELDKVGIKYHYFNMISLEEINELYNCLNLYVISSRCEGGPRAVFEAGLTKTPIISTRVGIAPELMARSSLFNAEKWESYKGAKPNTELLFNNVLKLTTDEYMGEFLNYLLY